MSEISVFDDTIFGLLDELYKLNHKSWKKRILLTVVQYKVVTYKQIRKELLEVPELLTYRCIKEWVRGEVLKRTEEGKKGFYTLSSDSKYIRQILKEL